MDGGEPAGERQRPIRARGTSGQVAGAATETARARSSSSTNGLPNRVLPESPCPGRPTVRPRPDSTFNSAVSCPETSGVALLDRDVTRYRVGRIGAARREGRSCATALSNEADSTPRSRRAQVLIAGRSASAARVRVLRLARIVGFVREPEGERRFGASVPACRLIRAGRFTDGDQPGIKLSATESNSAALRST